MSKSIEMNYKQGDNDYEVLYPQVTTNEVIDIHEYVINVTDGQIEGIIPNPYGVIKIKAVDSEGNPASVQLSVSPQINNSDNVVTDGTSGYFIAYVNPGTYVLTAPESSAFVSYEIDNPNCVVNVNKVTEVNVSYSIVQSGEMEITTSQQIVFPKGFNIPVDIWGCGGGPGGNCIFEHYTSSDYTSMSCGGNGGAYSDLYRNISVTGKTLQITIGSGGTGGSDSASTHNRNGGSGGTTNITGLDSSLSFQGGGIGGFNFNYTMSGGGNGGNGGGGVGYPVDPISSNVGNAGTNGGDGEGFIPMAGQSNNGGKGQGHSTYIFEDSNRTACCGALGGARIQYMGQPGYIVAKGNNSYGAGEVVLSVKSSLGSSGLNGGNATTYGSSGGSALINEMQNAVHYGGSGKQGVVYIRWPGQS